jgi:hypothetical protein
VHIRIFEVTPLPNCLLLQVAAQGAGGVWTAAQTLTTSSGVNASIPSVAISPVGNAFAAWEIYANQGFLIQSSTRQAHGSWTAATTVTRPGNSSSPKVGMDGDGNAFAVLGPKHIQYWLD